MKTIEVKVIDHAFTLACKPEEEAALLQAVDLVTTKMTALRDAGKIKGFERIAFLAALQFAGDYLQLQTGAGLDVAALQQILKRTHHALDAGLVPQEKLF